MDWIEQIRLLEVGEVAHFKTNDHDYTVRCTDGIGEGRAFVAVREDGTASVCFSSEEIIKTLV